LKGDSISIPGIKAAVEKASPNGVEAGKLQAIANELSSVSKPLAEIVSRIGSVVELAPKNLPAKDVLEAVMPMIQIYDTDRNDRLEPDEAQALVGRDVPSAPKGRGI
jgi:hypothetical protein